MREFLQEIADAKKLLAEQADININDIRNPCNLFNLETNELAGVYLYKYDNQILDHCFGYKVCSNTLTDFYILRANNMENNSNKVLNNYPRYHCVEYIPHNHIVKSKYLYKGKYLTKRGIKRVEIKYDTNDVELQRNYLCRSDLIPKEYSNTNIETDVIIGYTCKSEIKHLIIEGLEYNFRNQGS